jgi:hypothetical protein
MAVINTADKIYVGSSLASKVYSGSNQVWPAAAAYDAATVAWIAAVGSGNVDTAHRGYVDTLIIGLKTDGLWAKFDRLCIFAAQNTTCALTDLKALATGTAINSPTFTADRGFTCNGTAIVSTGFNPAIHGVQYTLNTAHVSVWCLTATASTTYTLNSGQTNMFTRYSGDTYYVRINNNAGGAGANTDGSGFFLGVRSAASGAGCITGYRNGTSLVSAADGVLGLDNAVLTVSDRQCAAVSAGATLSSTESTNFYNRLRTYMTSVGVP